MNREGHYQKTGRRPLKVMVAMLLSEPSGQRKLAGVFSHLGANPDWNLKILRTQSEITSETLRAAAADGLDGIILSVRYDKEFFSVLLKATQTPISSIPSLCGFRNANSLKNLFKRRFGVSMRAFRNGA